MKFSVSSLRSSSDLASYGFFWFASSYKGSIVYHHLTDDTGGFAEQAADAALSDEYVQINTNGSNYGWVTVLAKKNIIASYIVYHSGTGGSPTAHGVNVKCASGSYLINTYMREGTIIIHDTY